MEDEDKKIDAEGNKLDTPVEDSDAEYQRLKEKNNKIQEELIRGQKLKTESLLAGTAGGQVPTTELSPDEQKKEKAADFFKGTQLEKDIKKS